MSDGPYTIRKYNGDDSMSWAVFDKRVSRTEPVDPDLTGMLQSEARYHRYQLNLRFREQKRAGR